MDEESNHHWYEATYLSFPFHCPAIRVKIVYLTAGAAGMYCGSCMHDNALAKAMIALGHDVILQPIYTPIRTDETDISARQVLFGGIHVYALQQLPILRYLPRAMRSWMDRPGLIRWATRRAVKTDPAQLGGLTLSMLRGHDGRQAEEVERMVRWLENDVHPDAIILSNLLIGGAIPDISQRLPNTKIIVTLQGDDIFLDHLPDEYRSEAISLCAQLAKNVDYFVTNSRFYREKMGGLFGIDDSKFAIHPLSINLSPFENPRLQPPADLVPKGDHEFRIGYMARIAPEKGLHLLVEAFLKLAEEPGHDHVTLHAGGWLGEHNQIYLDELITRIEAAGLAERFVYHGSPSLQEKVTLLKSFDLLSVPSPYEDPKGLFVLESLAAGVPVLQPDHGAFPELIEATGGGECFPPEDHHELAESLKRWVADPELRKQLSDVGHQNVMSHHGIQQAAERMLELCGD